MNTALFEMQQMAGIAPASQGNSYTIIAINDSEELTTWRGKSFIEAYNAMVADCEGDDAGLAAALGLANTSGPGSANHEQHVARVAPSSPRMVKSSYGEYMLVLPW